MRRLAFTILLAATALVGTGCFRELDPEAFDVVVEADAGEESDSAATDADVTPAE